MSKKTEKTEVSVADQIKFQNQIDIRIREAQNEANVNALISALKSKNADKSSNEETG